MVISIKNTARDLKIRLPDLITRPVGRRMYEHVRANMEYVTDGEVVLMDFAGVQVIDSSFIDEFLLRLIEDSRKGGLAFFVKLTNITPIIEANINSVFAAYRPSDGRGIAVITEQLTDMNAYHLGDVSPAERDILDYLRINKTASIGNIASFISGGEEEAAALMEELYDSRLVRKETGSRERRYLQV